MRLIKHRPIFRMILHNNRTYRNLIFSEMPIMYVNVSGDYDGMTLKRYADKMQDSLKS